MAADVSKGRNLSSESSSAESDFEVEGVPFLRNVGKYQPVYIALYLTRLECLSTWI